MKGRLSIVAGLLVGLLLLWLAFRGVNVSRLPRIVARADLAVVLPVFLVTMLELFFRSLRWKLLLAPSKRVRLRDAIRLESGALALSNILPLRLGEAARGTYGAAIFELPLSTVLSSMLVERAMDATVLTLLFLLAAALDSGAGAPGVPGWVWALPAGLAAALAALAFAERTGGAALYRALRARFPRFAASLRRLPEGAAAFRKPGPAAAVTALAVLQWLMDALNLYLIAGAFGLAGVIGAARSVELLFTGAVAVSIPGVPGYFGNLEFAVSRVAAAWGVPADMAFAYATFSHVLNYLIFTGVGLISVYGMGQSLGRIWARFGRSGAKAALAAGQGDKNAA